MDKKRWSENLKGEWVLGKQRGKVRAGCIWLRTGTSGRFLRTRLWTFGLHKRKRISWL